VPPRQLCLRMIIPVACRAPYILSREELQAEKERVRAVDARPIKKVAEAKARKRQRLQARASKMPRQKLEKIHSQSFFDSFLAVAVHHASLAHTGLASRAAVPGDPPSR
jgi:Spb1 C-terminal domain